MVFEVKQNKNAWGNRFVRTHNGGKPYDAVGYAGEGFFWKKRFTDDALTPELKELGMTEEEWDTICQRLHDAMGFLHLGVNVWKFCRGIEALNEEYFDKIGCKAVRAEFGKGCKAMTVYTKEVWDAKPE